jgi:FG-GAP repeat
MKTHHSIGILAAIALLCITAFAADSRSTGATQPVSNPWFLQAELTGKDSPYNLGAAVSISGGTIAAAANDVVYVFTRTGGGWSSMTQKAKLTASDGSPLYTVAVSGNTIIAGAYTANNFTGEAFVFVEPSGGWTDMTETATLTASDAVQGYYFGISVAIDGNTAVAGAYENDSVGISYPVGAGAAYVFEKPSSGWASNTETAKLTASDGLSGDDLGYNVAISGNTIAASAPDAAENNTIGEGAVYVFQKTGLSWTSGTQTAKLTASNGEGFSSLGYTLSLNGRTIAAGALDQIYVFVEPSSGWANGTQTAELLDPSGYTFLLNAVSVCGPYVLGGYPETYSHPISDLYVEPSAGWANEGPTYRFKIPADNGIRRFGTSVDVLGTTLVIGSPLNGPPGGGIIYVYGPS